MLRAEPSQPQTTPTRNDSVVLRQTQLAAKTTARTVKHKAATARNEVLSSTASTQPPHHEAASQTTSDTASLGTASMSMSHTPSTSSLVSIPSQSTFSGPVPAPTPYQTAKKVLKNPSSSLQHKREAMQAYAQDLSDHHKTHPSKTEQRKADKAQYRACHDGYRDAQTEALRKAHKGLFGPEGLFSKLNAQVKEDPSNADAIQALVTQITTTIQDAGLDITQPYTPTRTPADPKKPYLSSQAPPASILERMERMLNTQQSFLKEQGSPQAQDAQKAHQHASDKIRASLNATTTHVPSPTNLFSAKGQVEATYHHQLHTLAFDSYYPGKPVGEPIFNPSQAADKQEHSISTEVKDQRLATDKALGIEMQYVETPPGSGRWVGDTSNILEASHSKMHKGTGFYYRQGINYAADTIMYKEVFNKDKKCYELQISVMTRMDTVIDGLSDFPVKPTTNMTSVQTRLNHHILKP